GHHKPRIGYHRNGQRNGHLRSVLPALTGSGKKHRAWAKACGVLLAVPGERGEDGSEVAFALPFALIADARLVMTDALLEEAAARQAEEGQLTDGAGQIAPDPAPESVAGDQERGKDMAEGPVERVEKTHG
ncbi:MAG: hypothetical protein AAGH45_04585, partial [Pseudomonadota bacterium]